MQTTNFSHRVILPGVIGNVLEIYDFTLYGYFAPIMSELFFPHAGVANGLLFTFAIFAIGFLIRPLGSLLFGHFGDRFGRRATLVVSIVVMALATSLIGLLPTYQQVGAWAGGLLLICRLFQGLAMSGEFVGSMVYLVEHAPSNQRGFYGSFAQCGTYLGILVGSAVAALVMHSFSTVTLHSWGWRIPFLCGILLGAVGLYLRLKMPETPVFLKLKQQNKIIKLPIKQVFSKAIKPMLIIVGFNFMPGVAAYTLFIYLATYLTTYLKLSLATALTINTINTCIIAVLLPAFGALSDKVGRKIILLTAAACFTVFSYPLFLLLHEATFFTVWLAQACFAVLIAAMFGALPAAMVELLDPNIRYTASAFPFNLASALFGGTAPVFVTLLITQTGSTFAPAWYIIVASLFTLWAVKNWQARY